MELIDYSHQTGFFDPTKFGWPVHLIGLGGIGSAVACPLAMLGIPELHLWDHDDEIELHNVPSQMYRVSDEGGPKVDAMLDFLHRQDKTKSCRITGHMEPVIETTPLSGVVISGVDSMKSRYAIWEAVCFNPDVPLYMDARVGGLELQLLTLNPCDPNNVQWYTSDELFPDEETEPLPCGQRTVVSPHLVLAGFITAQLAAFSRKETLRSNLRMHLGTMQFNASSKE